MPTLSDAFPSKYLKAGEDVCEGDDLTLTIQRYDQERIGQGADADDKYVLYFRGNKKGLVLNKTNAKVIAELHGDDLDDWIGKQITLYEAEVQFGNDTVAGIRVRKRKPNGKKPAPVTQADADEASAEHAAKSAGAPFDDRF